MTQGAGWDGLLEPGETILWQGQPVRGLRWRDMIGGRLPIGIFFTLFSLFWICMAVAILSEIGGPLMVLFPMSGLPFLAIGLYMLAGHVVWDAMVRAGTWYTLTDRTAFVATDILGRRRLQSWRLADIESLDLVDGEPGDVLFASSALSYPAPVAATRRSRHRMVRDGTTQTGFRRIAEARRVWRMMRDRRAALRRTEGDGTE
ncbi:hypothetical protein [Roseicyclus persicicus]|uniref:PH domain-containing protein n=1 Tax=Roseicyclus persicicus TaxID=2650661 RepID=A0A7X6JYA2_9RHOB|nr:hypothetical protein [Roseibacterium persicicum]NKX45600.1 hypothetical protein [Roseibacterium persicicum]